MDNERDIHFRNFAKLLYNDLYDEFSNLENQESHGFQMGKDYGAEQTRQDIHKIIAQRAYDLIMHVFSTMDPLAFQATLSDDEIMKSIPDLTEWPTP